MTQKRRAVVIGFEYYAQFLADLVNEHSQRWELQAYRGQRMHTVRAMLALRKADALISFGGPAPNAAFIAFARRYNIPIVVIWAGSDVIKAKADPFSLQVIKEERFHHISDGPWLVDELAVLGLPVEYEPVTAVRDGGPLAPFQKEFRVLTYLPEPRRAFYGADLVYNVARAMPETVFTVVGAGGKSNEAPPNVEFCGYVTDMQQRIDDATVLLRVPEHDGKSMLVLEALARGRHVVWNYEFPHVHTACTESDVLQRIQHLRALHEAGKLELNEAGRDFVMRNFSRRDTAARFEARLDRALEEQSVRRTTAKRSVAISGLGLFCGEVASRARTAAPEWGMRLMRTNSRLEVLTAIATLFTSDVWYSIGTGPNDGLLHWFAKLMRKPRVIHWVGSDIARLKKDPKLRSSLSSPDIVHLAEIDWTARELRELGLQARIAPLWPRHSASGCAPLPERFTVMLYVPSTRADFYGRRAFERLMRNLRHKNVRYLIVGGGSVNAPPGVEVENCGWRNNLHELYRNVTALIRFTPRDGLSLMVVEALSFGRHVLWTQPLPFVRRIRRYRDMERELLELLHAHETGELRPQTDASAYVIHEYSPERCMRAIVQSWDDAALRVSTHPTVAVQAP